MLGPFLFLSVRFILFYNTGSVFLIFVQMFLNPFKYFHCALCWILHTHSHTHTHTQTKPHTQKKKKTTTVVCLQLDCYIWRLDQQLASIFFSLSWSKQNKSLSVHYARSEFCRLLQNLLGLLIIKYRIMSMIQWTLIKRGGKHAESYTQWILPSASLTAPTVEKDPRIFFMSGNSSDLSSCVERRLGCCLSSLENSKLA